MPLRPARPVRPERCCSASASRGSSTWTTRLTGRKVEAARGDVGRDAHPGALVAQRLERGVALVLAMLARQSDRLEAAFAQRGVEAADGVAGGAEQDGRLGLVHAQQVDDGMLDVGRGDGHRLVGDVGMALLVAQRLDPQRILLVALGERDDRARHGGGEEQGAAALGRGRVEDFLELLAEAHVEHLVGLVEHGDLEVRQVERAAFEMIAKAARRADDDVHAAVERAAFLHRVHAADAGHDAGAGIGVEPLQFLADLDARVRGSGR